MVGQIRHGFMPLNWDGQKKQTFMQAQMVHDVFCQELFDYYMECDNLVLEVKIPLMSSYRELFLYTLLEISGCSKFSVI